MLSFQFVYFFEKNNSNKTHLFFLAGSKMSYHGNYGWLTEFFLLFHHSIFYLFRRPYTFVLFILSLFALFTLLVFPEKRVLLLSVLLLKYYPVYWTRTGGNPGNISMFLYILALVINYKNDKNAVSVIAFIFMSVYFFSGIGKMNPAFSIFVRNKIVSVRNLYK